MILIARRSIDASTVSHCQIWGGIYRLSLLLHILVMLILLRVMLNGVPLNNLSMIVTSLINWYLWQDMSGKVLNRFLRSMVIENMEGTLIRWSKNLCREWNVTLPSLVAQICHMSVLLNGLIFDIDKTRLLLPVLHCSHSSLLYFMGPWLIWTDWVLSFLWAKPSLASLRWWSSSNTLSIWVIILKAVALIVIVLIVIRTSCHASTKLRRIYRDSYKSLLWTCIALR